MPERNARQALLIVEQARTLSPREVLFKARLERLEFIVTVLGQDQVLPEAQTWDLILLCSERVSRAVRERKVPLIVGTIAALFDAGMTLAEQGTDFGLVHGPSIFIAPEPAQHPLAAGLAGEYQITELPSDQGWGRPGARAVRIATVGGDRNKAVIFAYNRDTPMPAMPAPHRRVAFLAGQTSLESLTHEGWRLFEAAVRWAAEGGGMGESEPTGYWSFSDGTPTRTMSAPEYRDWVHDQIVGKVWKQLLAVVSLIGISSLVALFYALQLPIASAVNERFTKSDSDLERKMADASKDVDAKFEKSLRALDAKIESSIKDKSIELLDEKTLLGRQLQQTVNTKADTQLLENIKDPKTRALLAQLAHEQLLTNGAFADDLLQRYEKIDGPERPELKKLLIQLLMVYQGELQRQKTQKLLLDSVKNHDEPEELRQLALTYYPPSGRQEADAKVIAQVLEQLANRQANFPPGTLNAYKSFIAHHSDVHAPDVLTWLSAQPAPLGLIEPLLQGILHMKQSDPKQPPVLGLLRDLLRSGEDAKTEIGVRGFGIVGRSTEKDFSFEAKRWALKELLKAYDSSTTLQQALHRVGHPDGKVTSPPVELVYKSELLINLLKSVNADFLTEQVKDLDHTEQRALQMLFFNWAELLQREETGQDLAQLYQAAKHVPDCLYRPGTVHVLEVTLREASSPANAEDFLRAFPGLVLGKTEQEVSYGTLENPRSSTDVEAKQFQGGRALLEAIVRNAESLDAFCETKNVLAQLDGEQKGTLFAEWLKDYVAVSATTPRRLQRPGPRVVGLPVRSELLALLHKGYEALDMQRQPTIRRMLGEALVREYQPLAGWYNSPAARQWQSAEVVYSRLLRIDTGATPGQRASWYYARGTLRSEKLRSAARSAAAIEDLEQAIQLAASDVKAKHPEYEEKLGDILLREKSRLDEAVKHYTTALSLYGPADGSARAGLHNKLALTHLLLPNGEAGVRRHIASALELLKTPQDRAGVLENLGLFYLRQGDFKKALQTADEVRALVNGKAQPAFFAVDLPWNALLRYLAAREAHDDVLAQKALATWEGLHVPRNMAGLIRFVPELMKKHLGLVRMEEGVLERTLRLNETVATADRFPILLEADKEYVIDMESSACDAYLFLRDAAGNVLRYDDDSGGGLNARIRFTPTRTGQYEIIATSLNRQHQGAYSLFVRQGPGEKK